MHKIIKLDLEVEHYFKNIQSKYLETPICVLILGPVCAGKTHFRKAHHARDFVNLDAGDEWHLF